MATKSLPLLRKSARLLPPLRLFSSSSSSSVHRVARPAAAIATAVPRSLFSTTPLRAAHSIPRPPPRRVSPDSHAATAPSGADAPASEGERPDVPSSSSRAGQNQAYYQLSFTCVPCGHRSHHNVSKQGYHGGSVLITCPSCRNRHVISDHLGIFGDRSITVEDLMREKGNLVKRGSLGEDGDIEFWPDDDVQAVKPGGSA
ncbi:hypothetical protein JDV02_001508 [Purpureocillium takamizusanense]|uniref:DNL-type domain-containing protein n=1 Tax=Purpureocillium takamizusanense TaxID=2060973 RepID=A0A9Q8V6I7_9HYPO|nr:uncharacterized protein JDV02_001508 [Purpureocillium takamizusanense]UNI14930.1 hypothetical protein JDV02_001508 [Purpureocillium takamizusanense]